MAWVVVSSVGTTDGMIVVGRIVGSCVGVTVGVSVGTEVVGALVGDCVGVWVGVCVGAWVGTWVGVLVGDFVGFTVGVELPVPVAPLTCTLGVLSCLFLLIFGENWYNWTMMGVWTVIGLAIYFFYGFKHSKLHGTA